VYLPLAQAPARNVFRRFMFSARARGEGAAAVPAIRSIATSLDRDQPIDSIVAMEDEISESIQLPRFRTALFTVLGGLALLLAATGVYGVLHYSVAQRTREIGIRMALGARGRDIVALVLRQSMTLVATGLAIGMGAALWLSRLLAGMLFEIQPRDPSTLIVVAVVVACAALAAAWFPARRAAGIEPVVTLRHE
jgi:putative ABC transport system permease protein